MPLNTQVINIPIGAGIDKRRSEFALQPPYLREAQNVSLTEQGALTKREGWAQADGANQLGKGDTANIIFNSKKTVARVSEDTHKLYKDGLQREMLLAPTPFEVTARPAISLPGTINGVQVAHMDGYTAVVASIANDPSLNTNNNWEMLEGWACILDDEWNIIWGPYRTEAIGILPRVEAAKASNVINFMFYGCEDVTGSAVTADAYVDATTLRLSCLKVVGPSFESETLYTVKTISTQKKTGQDVALYDTYCSGVNGDEVFLAYHDSTPDLVMASHTTTNTLTEAVIASTGTAPDTFCIWHDNATDTVLLWSAETGNLHYNNSALSSAALVAHPGTPPIADLDTFTDNWPIFWAGGDGTINLSDRPLSLVGSAPATPTFASALVVGKMQAKPLPRGTSNNGFFYDMFNQRTFSAGSYGKGGKILSTRVTGFSAGPDIVGLSPIMGTRHTASYGTNVARSNAARHYVNTQTAVAQNGNLLLPDTIVTSGFLPEKFPNGILTASAAQLSAGLGLISDAVTACVLDIDIASYENSYINFYGDALVAAGLLYTFDGVNYCPIAVRPNENGLASLSASVGSYYPVALGGGLTVSHGNTFEYAFTMSYVDRNNVRHRWDGGTGAVEGPEAPEDPDNAVPNSASVNLPEELVALAHEGLLTLEIYARLTGTSFPTPLSNRILIARAPIFNDGGAWVCDFGVLQSPTGTAGTNTPYPYASELAGAQLPLTNIVEQAGSYIFCVAQEFPTELWTSKPLGPYAAPEFPATGLITAPPNCGEIKSLASQDDHLYVMGENGVWELFVGGPGPAVDGTGGFPEFTQIYIGPGALHHRGTVSGDFGVIYMAADGPKLIQRGQVTDIGQVLGSSDFNFEQVTVSHYDEKRREVWFFFEGASAAVWDVDLQSWTTATFEALGAVRIGSEMYRVDENGYLGLQSTTRQQDLDNSYFLGKVVSPWLKMSTPTGYKRFRKVGALFNSLNTPTHGSIIIKVAYDYVDTDIDTFTFNATDFASFDRLMTFVVRCTRQKSDAIRITIEEGLQNNGESNVNNTRWALSGLDVRVGSKRGHVKLQEGAKK